MLMEARRNNLFLQPLLARANEKDPIRTNTGGGAGVRTGIDGANEALVSERALHYIAQ